MPEEEGVEEIRFTAHSLDLTQPMSIYLDCGWCHHTHYGSEIQLEAGAQLYCLEANCRCVLTLPGGQIRG